MYIGCFVFINHDDVSSTPLLCFDGNFNFVLLLKISFARWEKNKASSRPWPIVNILQFCNMVTRGSVTVCVGDGTCWNAAGIVQNFL